MATFIDGLLDDLRNKGRYGDTELAHINSNEATLLRALGGSGTINPNTGLKEYWQLPNWMTDIAEDAGLPVDDYIDDYGGYIGLENEPDEPTIDTGPPEDWEPPKPFFDEKKIGTRYASGEEYELTTSELAKYIDPETNTIKDSQGLEDYLRKVNPEFADKNDKGEYIWTRTELMNWMLTESPGFFADRTKVKAARDKFKSSAESSRTQASTERMKSDIAGGVSGTTRGGKVGFGGQDEKISEALYGDISDKYEKYSQDIYGLEEEAIGEAGEFIYGSTDPDSPYSGL